MFCSKLYASKIGNIGEATSVLSFDYESFIAAEMSALKSYFNFKAWRTDFSLFHLNEREIVLFHCFKLDYFLHSKHKSEKALFLPIQCRFWSRNLFKKCIFKRLLAIEICFENAFSRGCLLLRLKKKGFWKLKSTNVRADLT